MENTRSEVPMRVINQTASSLGDTVAGETAATVPLYEANQRYLFQKRLNTYYPHRFVRIVGIFLILVSLMVMFIELKSNDMREQRLNLYFVSKYSIITSFANAIYAILALITLKRRSYFLIQLVSLLMLVGFFASCFFLAFLNAASLMLLTNEHRCDVRCLLSQVQKVMLGLGATGLTLIYFLRIQVSFLKKLNQNEPFTEQ